MFLWFTSILTLAAAAADIIHYRRLRRRGTSARNLRLFVALAAATDALPPVIALTDALSRDNTTGFMLFAMWAFWAWMITVLPRIACYFFRLIGLPRAGIAAGICVAALLIWGSTRGRTQIRVSRTEVCSERIPAGFDGFRIVQFSDVHLGTLVCPEAELSRIADSINSLHPDLVVFCGDLVNIRGSNWTPAPCACWAACAHRTESCRSRATTTPEYTSRTASRIPPKRVWPRSSHASGKWGGACWRTRPSTCGAAATASR